MKSDEQDIIQMEDLLRDEMMRSCLGEHYDSKAMMHQLLDPTLMGLDLDEVCELDINMLIFTVLQVQEFVTIEQINFVTMLELERKGTEEPSMQVCVVPEEFTEGERLIHITFDQSMVEAHIVMDEPKEGNPAPDEREIRTALLRAGVVYGMKEDYIDRLVQNPIYNRKIKIAQGKEALPGTDGQVTYRFTPVFDLAPKIDEYGVADYKALDFVQNVKKGDLLCDIVRATAGSSGISVCGDVITGSMGKPAGLQPGVNTILSDDGTKLYTTCDGQVFLKGETVYVRRVLVVDRVDTSTGNLFFVGSIHIKGDVADGFSVRASGNIVIDGMAENAILVAGNNIILCGGIKGSGKAMLTADGSVRALYIENARVQAKGGIYADSILNSQVESSCGIHISGINGKLIGGVCTAGEVVCAKQIGNDAGVPTIVNVRDPDVFGQKKAQNMMMIAKYREAIVRLNDAAEFAAASNLEYTPPEVMLCRAVATKIRMERAIVALEIENRETDAHQKNTRYIEVSHAMYPNVSFTIDDVKCKIEMKKPGYILTKIGEKLIFRTYQGY